MRNTLPEQAFLFYQTRCNSDAPINSIFGLVLQDVTDAIKVYGSACPIPPAFQARIFVSGLGLRQRGAVHLESMQQIKGFFSQASFCEICLVMLFA